MSKSLVSNWLDLGAACEQQRLVPQARSINHALDFIHSSLLANIIECFNHYDSVLHPLDFCLKTFYLAVKHLSYRYIMIVIHMFCASVPSNIKTKIQKTAII